MNEEEKEMSKNFRSLKFVAIMIALHRFSFFSGNLSHKFCLFTTSFEASMKSLKSIDLGTRCNSSKMMVSDFLASGRQFLSSY